MDKSFRQQLVVSGVGGQGVLFVTRLLAEAAIDKGLSVFTSETHGMAQRGGSVISHVKAGSFSSPLIRPSQSDGLLALKPNSLSRHGFYLKPGGWAVVNSAGEPRPDFPPGTFAIDADGLARRIGNPKSVNLIVLGFALAEISKHDRGGGLFCSMGDMRTVLENRLAGSKRRVDAAIEALDAGYAAAGRR